MMLMRGVDIKVTFADGGYADFVKITQVDIEDGVLILRDGHGDVMTAFSPSAWAEVNRR